MVIVLVLVLTGGGDSGPDIAASDLPTTTGTVSTRTTTDAGRFPGPNIEQIECGTFEQAMVYEIVLFGPMVGGPDFVIEVTVGPGNLLLKMSMPGASIELLEPWG